MADSAVPITAGTGTNVDTRTEATNGDHRQVVVVGDPSVTAGVAAVDATLGVSVNVTASAAVGSLTETAPASDTASSGLNGRLQRIAQRLTSLIALFTTEDTAIADGAAGLVSFAKRTAAPANSSGTDGDAEPLQVSNGYLWTHDNKGLANLVFVAAFSTLTRPANTTGYTGNDSISDNATAGSVTALSATVSDVNDDPFFIADILINSTDTGLAGKKLRANVFNADPTSSSGVGAGDNVAYSQKKNGYIGTFVGTMESGFSDGSVGRLVPSFRDTNYTPAGGFVAAKPTSGAKTLYIQYVAEEAFTPSANSTTIIGTARGWQARAV